MPTYGYECKACTHSFDYFQGIKDEPLKDCPKCGQGSLRRLITGGTGVIFKGDGFYVTEKSTAKKSPKTDKPDTAAGSACQGCPAASDSGSGCPGSQQAAKAAAS